MGDFTDKLLGGNGQGGKAIPPIGSTHYQMAEISFYLNRTPKEILGEVLGALIKQLQEGGHFEAAQQLTKNPQPFYGNPHALAVFMACSVELEKRDERISKLEAAVEGLAEALVKPEDKTIDTWFYETLMPAAEKSLSSLREGK